MFGPLSFGSAGRFFLAPAAGVHNARLEADAQ